MKGFFRYVDRRIVVAFVLVLVAVLALRVSWVNGNRAAVTKSQVALVEEEKKLAEFRDDITKISSEGVSSGEDLIVRVGRMEQLVPATTDVLSISANFIVLAESSGVVLDSFSPVEKGKAAAKESLARVLDGSRFTFSATGDFNGISGFLTAVVASPRMVATVDSLEIVPTSSESGVFGTAVRATGEVVVWSLNVDPLAPVGSSAQVPPVQQPNPIPSPSTTLDPSAPTTTLDPSAPTSVPSPSTSVPSPSTSVAPDDEPDDESPADDI